MGLYLVIIYIACIVSTFFISAVRNHKVIKRHTREIMYNDCYYLNPKEHKWSQKMVLKMLREDEIKPSEEAHIKDRNDNSNKENKDVDKSNTNILNIDNDHHANLNPSSKLLIYNIY